MTNPHDPEGNASMDGVQEQFRGTGAQAQGDDIDALAHRFWSVHPREIQDMGITREQFYAQEIRALIEAHPAPTTPVGRCTNTLCHAPQLGCRMGEATPDECAFWRPTTPVGADTLPAGMGEKQEYTILYKPKPTAADTERDKLIEYFRGEGYSRFGYNGDVHGWSPAETAINAMRELDGKAPAAADTGGLVERLREYGKDWRDRAADASICEEAASALAAAREQIAELERRGVETQMLAFKWMEAHDKRADGKPYDFPTTTDVPDTIVALSSAQEQIRVMRVLLTEARAEIDYSADTAREHYLVARIDAALTRLPEGGQ